jgi:hypothetical protein
MIMDDIKQYSPAVPARTVFLFKIEAETVLCIQREF